MHEFYNVRNRPWYNFKKQPFVSFLDDPIGAFCKFKKVFFMWKISKVIFTTRLKV